jgi:hypothetical protein
MEGLNKHRFLAGALAALLLLVALWFWGKGSAYANDGGGFSFGGSAPPGKVKLLPEVVAFKKELRRADNTDAVMKLRELLSATKKQERALRFRVASANKDLHLDEFFERDADAARFYGDDWLSLSGVKGDNAEAMLAMTKALEEVSAGESGTISPEAAQQILAVVRGRLVTMQARIMDAHATLTIIMRLAASTPKGKADVPAGRIPGARGEEAFLISHQDRHAEVAPQRTAPAWNRDVRRLLDKYRAR